MKYILDTSAWFAFMHSADSAHARAVEVISHQPKLLVGYPVFEEITAVLHHRVNKPLAIKACNILLSSKLVDLVYFGSEENKQVMKLYEEFPKGIDYVDASVAWLARKYAAPVFTFDKHFRELNLVCVPK